jgi:hypothetical protein
MNIKKRTLEALQNDGYLFSFNTDYEYNVSCEAGTEMYINGLITGNGKEVTIKATKKQTNYKYIMNQLNKDTIYKNFAKDFQKLISNEYEGDYTIYPTSYGIGIYVFGNGQRISTNMIRNCERILNNFGIKYTTEYSEMRYVYRYRISKSAENISKIKNLIK